MPWQQIYRYKNHGWESSTELKHAVYNIELTLSMPDKKFEQTAFWNIFSYFSQKIGFDIVCKLNRIIRDAQYALSGTLSMLGKNSSDGSLKYFF